MKLYRKPSGRLLWEDELTDDGEFQELSNQELDDIMVFVEWCRQNDLDPKSYVSLKKFNDKVIK